GLVVEDVVEVAEVHVVEAGEQFAEAQNLDFLDLFLQQRHDGRIDGVMIARAWTPNVLRLNGIFSCAVNRNQYKHLLAGISFVANSFFADSDIHGYSFSGVGVSSVIKNRCLETRQRFNK